MAYNLQTVTTMLPPLRSRSPQTPFPANTEILLPESFLPDSLRSIGAPRKPRQKSQAKSTPGSSQASPTCEIQRSQPIPFMNGAAGEPSAYASNNAYSSVSSISSASTSNSPSGPGSTRRPSERNARSLSPLRFDRPVRARTPPALAPPTWDPPRWHNLGGRGRREFLDPSDADVSPLSEFTMDAFPAPPRYMPSSTNMSREHSRGREPSKGLRLETSFNNYDSSPPTLSYSSSATSSPPEPASRSTTPTPSAAPRSNGGSSTTLSSYLSASPPTHTRERSHTYTDGGLRPAPLAPRSLSRPRTPRKDVPSMCEYLSMEQLEDLWQAHDMYGGLTVEAPQKAPPSPQPEPVQLLEARTYVPESMEVQMALRVEW